MRRDTSKSARDFVFRSKCMFGGRALPGPAERELKRSPDFIFKSQMHQKRLAAELRPDPLGELQRSPRPANRSVCHAMQLGAHCCEEEGGVEISEWAEIYESVYV